MRPLDIDTALDWRGRTVVDRDGEKIGKFEELYLDESDRPAWAAVKTGLFGPRQTFVPLSEARPDGDVLQVPFDKDAVKAAPSMEPGAQLSSDEEDRLYRHYNLRPEGDGADSDARASTPAAEGAPSGERSETREAPAAGPATAADEAGPATGAPERRPSGEEATATATDEGAPAIGDGDDAPVEMIRSEEKVDVGTRQRVRGRARLKKYVVTDHVQKVVPVRREEVRVEFEPGPGEEADDAAATEGRRPDPAAAGGEPDARDRPADRR